MYACDERWWRHHWDSVKELKSKKWTQVHNDEARKFAADLGLNTKPGAGHSGLGRDKIHHGGNSGYQAINLAYLLGATRIILLGYDMSSAKGQHFFGSHPPNMPNGNYKDYIPRFNGLAKDLEREGVEVINCTPDSALTQFPKADLCALLS